MSRHRNMGGWIAETEEPQDFDDSHGASDLPINTLVMAKFYGEDQWYPGKIIDFSQHGYMVVFDGYEDDGAQDTDPLDVELVKLPVDNADDVAIDLDTFNDLAAEIASVMEGEVTTGDIRAALEACSFKVEPATSKLLDWVAAGKPGGAFAKSKAAKNTPAKSSAGSAATPKKGAGCVVSASPGPSHKTPKTPKPKQEKETPPKKAGPAAVVGSGARQGSAGTWTVTREMDSLGLDASLRDSSGGREADGSVEEAREDEAFDDVVVSAEGEEEEDTISLVVVGHVDAGKSTLNGHLLYLLGEVDSRTMHKNEKDSKAIGKGSFSFAWLLDGTAEERERGVTIDVGVKHVKTEKRRLQLLDAPGHRDFVPNMISGVCQADAAVLVIDGSTGEFESSFQGGGQVIEHAILVRSLGVQQLIVAVNKLDNVNYSEERFKFIVAQLAPFLKSSGYRASDVQFVPCSAFKGENLVKVSEPSLASWYTGPTLLGAIDLLKSPVRLKDLPLRLSLSDIFKTTALGTCVAGRVEGGTIAVGARLICRPGDLLGQVRALERHGRRVSTARAGDLVTCSISGMDMDNVKIGCILCPVDFPIPLAAVFLAQIVVFDVDVPVTKGYQATMYVGSSAEPVALTKLLCTVNKSSGQVLKKKVTCQRPVCLEVFSEYKQLGRFTLRESGKSIAAGNVMRLLS